MASRTNRTPRPSWQNRCAATGGALGVALATAASHAASTVCAADASRVGACARSGLLAAKPYVTGALIGLLFGALIAIAAVLVWREALIATAPLRERAAGPSALPSRRAQQHLRPSRSRR